jgi:hypothetical protein
LTEHEKIEARQRLIVYIRANTKRYVERMGADGVDWDFVEDIRKILNAYDSELKEIPINNKSK